MLVVNRIGSFCWALTLAIACFLMVLASTLPAQDGQQIELTDEEREWLAEHSLVRIAPAPNYPPIEFFDDDGEYRGIVADYVSLIESRLGIQLQVLRYATWS